MAPRTEYAPGETIPGTIYRVVGKIGSGGMGAVYEVEDTSVGRRYVLKAMHPDLCDRKDLTRRMEVEARTLGRLSHANIVEVVTAGVTADDPPRPFFVMERLEGRSLREVLEAKGRLSLSHAVAIMLDLLSALSHAHVHDVIHRDVKPDNVFLHRPKGTRVTTTKLLDFGIMRVARAEQSETAGRFVGTLRYAAPEQLRGARATPQTDIYAAALVLYEMVAGRGPFDDEGDAKQVASAHIRKEAPLLSSLADVPPELDALLASALSKDAEERPATAQAFGDALQQIPWVNRARAPDEAQPESSTEPPPAQEAEPRSRMRGVSIALVALLALVGTILALRAFLFAPAEAVPDAPAFIPHGPSGPAPVLAPPLFDEVPSEPAIRPLLRDAGQRDSRR